MQDIAKATHINLKSHMCTLISTVWKQLTETKYDPAKSLIIPEEVHMPMWPMNGNTHLQDSATARRHWFHLNTTDWKYHTRCTEQTQLIGSYVWPIGGQIKSNRLVSKTSALASYDRIGIGVQTMQYG